MTLISVIIPFHKNLRQLSQSVQSVVTQRGIPSSYTLEIVVSNDSHHSIETITSELTHILVNSPFTLVVVNNPSIPCAGFNRNSAIRNSTGELLAFLDSDDIWLPYKLSKQLDKVSRGFNFICTSYYVSNIHYLPPPSKIFSNTNAFFLFNPIGTSTVLVSRALISSYQFSNLKFSQDILFWAHVLRQPHLSYAAVSEPLVVYSRSGRTSTSSVCEQLSYYYDASFLFSNSPIIALFSTLIYVLRSVFRPVLFIRQRFGIYR